MEGYAETPADQATGEVQAAGYMWVPCDPPPPGGTDERRAAREAREAVVESYGWPQVPVYTELDRTDRMARTRADTERVPVHALHDARAYLAGVDRRATELIAEQDERDDELALSRWEGEGGR